MCSPPPSPPSAPLYSPLADGSKLVPGNRIAWRLGVETRRWSPGEETEHEQAEMAVAVSGLARCCIFAPGTAAEADDMAAGEWIRQLWPARHEHEATVCPLEVTGSWGRGSQDAARPNALAACIVRLTGPCGASASLEDAGLRLTVRLVYLELLIKRSTLLPVSYNQMLISGSLRYCWQVLKRLRAQPPAHELLRRIERYIEIVADLLRTQLDGITARSSTPFSRLDLQIIEDKFGLIERDASDLGILPRLDDMTIEDFLDSE